jgi:hypothetical protein
VRSSAWPETPEGRSSARRPQHPVLLITFAATGIVVAERHGCFSADITEAARSSVLVGYDARSAESSGIEPAS